MISGRPRAEAHRNCYRDLPRKTGRERVPPGRPAPLPQAADQAGPEGRAPRAAPPGAPARQALLCRLAAERAARAAGGGAWARVRWRRRPSGAAGRAVTFARRQLGKPCVWGASGPSSYDCSGLMVAACRSAGVWLPWVSRAQFSAGPRVGLGSLAPGDLVFFAYNTGNPGSIHHVGVYIGGGAMIEAPYSGARCASPPSAAGTTSAPSGRPADRLGAVGKDSSC